MSEWKTVMKGKKRTFKCTNNCVDEEISQPHQEMFEIILKTIHKLINQSEDCKNFLKIFIKMIQKWNNNLKKLKIRCLALGSLQFCKISQIQLSVLILLRQILFNEIKTEEKLEEWLKDYHFEDQKMIPCLIYDPVFAQQDKLLLKKLKFEVIEKDELLIEVEEPTCFYIIHGINWMFEKLLFTNWKTLNNLFVIGNRFETIQEFCQQNQTCDEFLQKLNDNVIEEIIPSWKHHFNAFNDTSIFTFKNTFIKV